jgi:hypothetical protein
MSSGKRKTVKYLMTAILVLIISMSGFLVAGAEPVKGGLEMKVNGGYGDVARVGSQVPFRISISNNGEDIDGEIQVLVDLNNRNTVIYALPVNLPAGSSKEVLLYAPLSTANRKVEVRLAKGKKTLKSVSYSFQKLLSPENPTIAILSDDMEAMRELEGIKLPEGMNYNMNGKTADIAMKRAVAIAAGEKVAAADLPVEVFRLDEKTLPEEARYFDGFDILIVSNYDTSRLSEKQINMLEEWIQKGNMLFIGTGENSVKTMSGLPDSFMLIKKDGEGKAMPESLGKFIEKSSPAGNLNIITGKPTEASVLLDTGGVPLVVSDRYGSGCITVLAFDPTLSPVSDWDNAGLFWQKLITEAYNKIIVTAEQQGNPGNLSSYRNYENMASQVPETQTPPFTALLILVGVYILIAGPLVYLFLKWKDKRDFNWLVIPAVALIFLALIYVAGFKTRYTKAVLNNFSVIKIDNSNNKLYIDTVMGVFNNKRSDMKLQYDRYAGFDVNPGSNYYDYYSYSTNTSNDDTSKSIIGKMTYTDPYIYDLYNVGMWEPRYIYASKVKDTSGSVLSSVSIIDGKLKAMVMNTTGMDFRDAFIVFGNNFINVGDVFPGDKKEINVSLSDASITKRFSDYLDARYGSNYNTNQNRKDPEWLNKLRKRNMLENVYNNITNLYSNNTGHINIMLFALDYDDPQYTISVNGEDPQKFNSNVLYSQIGINPEKGSKVEIPSGIVIPSLETSEKAFYDGGYDNGVRVQADGDVFFKVSIPDSIEVQELKINWASYMPSYAKYQQQQKNGAVQQLYAKDKYEFYIYNCRTTLWEKFDGQFTATGDMGAYIDPNGEVQLKSTVTLDKSGAQALLLGLPEINLKGVAK